MVLNNNFNNFNNMICPKCKSDLLVSDTHGVEIDYCPNCKGVWLDRGELDKIITRSNSNGFQNNIGNGYSGQKSHHDNYHELDHHDKYDHHDNQYNPRHKKGFLSDLFDF